MLTPRKAQISKHANGHYHCISRAVRRAFYVVLVSKVAVIMSNHYHLVLHVDYEHSLNWNAEEVVKRWEYFKWLSSFLLGIF
ncbi:hypothetical protein [Candidatus Venteria ishoeyi]|uniref:Transposase IS200-like domain-containing protein n=1 Tax=Candidatus Venteria ishoeyi TaxID=1899563 RepID=A0A1H6FGJ8_9GAMM|nr:hypothetical protein [Candidatus Venteria ishoeyi]SEH09182.1 Uncharacterised protein [Candidatus Venteria ishoeyi]SEH09310.1 Uncharacterised protein [Candidatus Venteria ishoeyi]